MLKSDRLRLTSGPRSVTVIVVKNDSLSEQAIRRELAKLLTSQIFARSERFGRFLQFTVDQVLAGKQSELKEYVIGLEVYDRRSPYHPSVDSIVRTEWSARSFVPLDKLV